VVRSLHGQCSFTGDGDFYVDFTVVPAAIPEYPYGLALVALFMVLGYAVMKRRFG